MGEWRIEQAKTDRSTCRQCGLPIAINEHRFGKEATLGTAWYHLGCAAAGKPRAFKPFAEQAAKLASKAAAKAPATAAPQHADLVARLVANPDDATRGIYADWLQSQGDPLGEYIALELAGNAAAAKKLFAKHRAAFTGGFSTRMFEWHKGLVDAIRFQNLGRAEARSAVLDKILALPAAVVVRRIRLPARLDARLVAQLNAKLPPTVSSLFVYFTNEVAGLALPELQHLELWGGVRDGALDVEALAPFFAATGLPKVRALSIYGNAALPANVAAALLDSPLVRQLDNLEITHYVLDAEGEAVVTARQDRLRHLTAIRIARLEDMFPAQHAAWKTYPLDKFGDPRGSQTVL